MNAYQEFEVFKKAAEKESLSVRQCTMFHWQVVGDGTRIVNFYPTKMKAYVDGAVRAAQVKNTAEVIQLCLHSRNISMQKQKRLNNVDRKRELLQEDNRCHWCGTVCEYKSATVDHLVPLSKGGTNSDSNTVLSCQPCNSGRGSDVPDEIPSFENMISF